MVAPSPHPGETCRIGKLTLDPDNQCLLRDGVPLPLGRRAVSLLHRLVQNPGEIVGRKELFDVIWQGRIVDESNLDAQISQLRRTLREVDPSHGGWIETLARRGYRFTGPAEWQAALPIRAAPWEIVSNIPVAIPTHFTGREASLDALHAALTADRTARAPVAAAMHGLRGVGKTILAAAYAQRHAADFRAVWWLRAETGPTLGADLAALAIRLRWANPDAAEDIALTAALDGLRRDGDRILLIYDNALSVAAVSPYLPKSGDARIIITANTPAWRAVATPIEIAVWPAAIGADYLIGRTGRAGERTAAQRLSETLGGLPLAHEQAASYIEYLELPIAEYQRRFETTPARLLDQPAHAAADYHGGLTVAKAFDLAIAQASAAHPAAERLLNFAAMLAAEPIPVFLFRDGRDAFGATFAAQLAGDGLDETLAALRAFGLISREAIADERDAALQTACVRLHRLVRQVAASRLSPADQDVVRATLITVLDAIYPQGVFSASETWPRARRLDAVALPLVAPPAIIPDTARASACDLLNGLASFRHGALAEFGQARPLFERSLELAEAIFGPDHQRTAQALNNLALLLRDHGDLAAALPLAERALAIREATIGPDHPDTSGSLNNVANVYLTRGDYAAARPLLERALAIRRSVFGEYHRETGQGINNLATLLHRMGEFTASRALHQQALAVRQACLPPGDPAIANSCNNLALVHLDLGEADAASGFAERGIAIAEAALGSEHFEVAGLRATLARVILAQGDAEAALLLAERALGVLSEVLVPGAPSLRRAAAIAAECLEALGRGVEAREIGARYDPR